MHGSRISAWLVGIAVCAVGAAALPVAAQQQMPQVEGATIWIGTVQRGDIVRQVRGPATLERFGRGMQAHVRIAATRAASVELDQEAEIDIRRDKLAGRVVHLDDRIVEGTLAVIVEITGELPEGLLPGAAADVRIDVEHLEDVVYVDRPAFAQADVMSGIFKIVGDGNQAERTAVRWGAASIDKIVVAEGLEPGDRIILSDMSRYDAAARVRIVG